MITLKANPTQMVEDTAEVIEVAQECMALIKCCADFDEKLRPTLENLPWADLDFPPEFLTTMAEYQVPNHS